MPYQNLAMRLHSAVNGANAVMAHIELDMQGANLRCNQYTLATSLTVGGGTFEPSLDRA